MGTAAQARSTEAEALNSKHLAAEVSAITTPRGPRDASHLLGQSDASRSMAAIKAANKHLDSEVADITSGIDPAKPRLAAQEKPKHKVVKTHDTKSNTAKMLAGEAKLEQARKDHLFNVYTPRRLIIVLHVYSYSICAWCAVVSAQGAARRGHVTPTLLARSPC